jgi:hypothetical protein
MDLPPSGWYPDPHGTPSLLRWWDGSVWTQHTHPDVSAGGAGTTGGEQAAGVAATGAQAAAVQATTVQPAAVHATAVQSAARPLGARSAGGGHPGSGRPGGQPSADWLRRTSPPTGRPTQPQPALPDTVAPTAYQPAVTTVQPAALQPTTVQPAARQLGVQPTSVQPTTVQPTVVQPGYPQPRPVPAMTGRAGGGDGAGTQVLFMGDQWQQPADPWQPASAPGMPGGPGADNRYGYQAAQRKRRRLVIGGITAGTAVAVAAIVVIAMNLGGSPAATTADQTQATPAAPATSAAPSVTASASPSPSASASPSATVGGSLLSDGQSGLSYTQLAAPWQGAGCPSALNNGAFTWTDGEYATAGQVNGGSTTWYGEACSGPLPQQYGYTGTAQLQAITENLAGTFSDVYYNALQHNTTPEADQAVQVNGHSGWEVSYDVSYTNAAAQGVTWADEQAAVVVVDTGTGGEPAVFFTSIPQTLNEGNVGTLISSLQLISAAPTGATATAAATGTATAAVAGGANP